MPKRVITERWPWTNMTKDVILNRPVSEVKSVEIDPSQRLADVNRSNNKFEVSTLMPKK
jgi:hypothetical protein